MKYNLLEERWIPVLYHDGTWKRVGIQKALEDAARIRQIAASNPMDRVAILRFLLALLYWSRGNPPALQEKDGIAAGGGFPAEWFEKLVQWEDCFNLLGDGKRFYQNRAYSEHTPEHTTNYLIHEVPSGTNKWHFRHATDMVEGLCPSCCALGLVRLPAFATSGGKGMSLSTGKSPGINAKPPLYVIPVGRSLASTLVHSWHPAELGTPEWETPGNKLPLKGEVPLLTGLTWLPRSVWLGDPEAPESVCASCGRGDRLIRRCVFDGKGSSKAEARIWRDPHVIYDAGKDGRASCLQSGDALGATEAAASEWSKRLAAILRARHLSSEGTLWIVGFATVKNDKYLEATEYLVRRSGQSQKDDELIAVLERWQKEGANLVRRIRPRSSSRKHVEIRPAIDAIRPDVEARVSAGTRELLTGDNSAWEHAAREYRHLAKALSKSLSPGLTTHAVKRRNEIAQTRPDMRPKPPAIRHNPKDKKGSGQ